MIHHSDIITVLDFRRRRMAVRWNLVTGTWSVHEDSPAKVQGIAFIRPLLPAVCVYGSGGRLLLQIGARTLTIDVDQPKLSFKANLFLLGYRRTFLIEEHGHVIYRESYWASADADFFRRLTTRCADPSWRISAARRWSEGETAAELRERWTSPP